MLDAKKNRGRALPYLRNPNVQWLDIDTTNLQTMLFEPHEDDRYGLRKGDVIACEGGEAGRAAVWDGRLADVKFQKALHRVRPGPQLDAKYLVGKTAIVRDPRPMAYAGYLIRLRVKPDNDPEYLSAFLNTRYAKRILRGMCKSIIGMANINATELRSIRIPQPPFALQKAIRSTRRGP